jgi:hypothetical protein
MNMRRILLLSFVSLCVGCSAFYIPDEKDDGVQRCDNQGDCKAPSDGRFDVECVFGEGQDDTSQKVCAPIFAIQECDPDKFPADHPFTETWTAAQDATGTYIPCDDMNKGTQGCKPRTAGNGTPCDAGLEVNDYGVCDDPEADFAAVEANKDIQGFDVLDQFCRSYFCDANWVCDASGGQPLCKVCRDGEAPGEGGCVEVYLDGTKSSIYTDSVDCSGGLDSTRDVEFGDIPGA